MRLTVLGSGTALPDPDRGPAGLVVTHGSTSVLIDGGAGTQQRLARAGVDPMGLSAVVYSHRHADHTGELVPLLFARKARRHADPLPVVAAEGFATFLDGLAIAWGPWVRDGVLLTERARKPAGSLAIGTLTLHHAPASHGRGALHLGLGPIGDDRPTVVFSGDTGPSDALVELARHASLLVCECGSPRPGGRPGHLSPPEIAELVDAARPACVWLTHLYPDTDPEQAVRTVGATGVPVHRAADGDTWQADVPNRISRPPGPR